MGDPVTIRVHVDGATWTTAEVVSGSEVVLRIATDTAEIELVGDPFDVQKTVVDADRDLNRVDQ